MRDNFGITQCVADSKSSLFKTINDLKNEYVVKLEGLVVERSNETKNLKLPTGEVELNIESVVILSKAEMLPLPINIDTDYGEETRLKYRFLDLRRNKIHNNFILRSKVISSLRKNMIDSGFLEFQTPILTSTSPEGARDYLVPSRLHPGKFYALPQAPQQFKQLLMIAGFDRYFQIAPCFRDEDSRADRSPGEFYQLDFEMSFVELDDVLNTIEPVLYNVFDEFSDYNKEQKWNVSKYPFKRIPYKDALNIYGTDKPDLRNPLLIERHY